MKLPRIPNTDRIVKNQQFRFGGYNHTAHAKDGEIYDEKNVSSERFPLIEPRETRRRYTGTKNIIWKGSRFSFPTRGRIEFVSGSDPGDIIDKGDMLEITATRDYQSNSGTIIVNSISGSFPGFPNKRQIVIDPTYGEGTIQEWPVVVTESTQTHISEKNAEVTIRIVKKRTDSSVVETVESDPTLTDETSVSDNTTEEGDIIKRTVIRKVSKKKKHVVETVERGSITYDSGTGVGIIHIDNRTTDNSSEYYLEKDIFKVGDKFRRQSNTEQLITRKLTSDDNRYDKFEVAPVSGSVNGSYQTTKYTATYGTATTDVDERYEDDDGTESAGTYIWTEAVKNQYKNIERIVTTESTEEMPLWETTTVKTVYTIELADYSGNIVSAGAGDKIYYVTADGGFWYNGIFGGTLEKGEKKFCETGAYIYIIPDNAYYDKGTQTLYTEHLTLKKWQTRDVMLFYSESGSGQNKTTDIQVDNADLRVFENKYLTIRLETETGVWILKGTPTNVSEHFLEFNSHLSEDAGYDYKDILPKGDNLKIRSITISESFPELKFICAAANRIWGCDTETIFCTAFGKPFSWFEYPASDAGNDADGAWSVTPFAGGGEFTGACVYMGTPFFFTENKMYKIYGDRPGTFSARDEDIQGVISGADKTLLPTSDGLFWLSREGIMRWAGGADTNISRDFGESFVSGAAGTDGRRVYFSLTNDGSGKNFLYDTDSGLWNREDETVFSDIFFFEGNMYGLHDNYIYRIGKKHYGTADPEIFNDQEDEDEVESFIEFGDHYNDTINKKCVSKLYFRMSAETGSEVEIKINYDSEKENGERVWRAVKTIEATEKRSFILPVIPRRCDHFRIRIEGVGQWRLHGMSFDYYVGSEI